MVSAEALSAAATMPSDVKIARLHFLAVAQLRVIPKGVMIGPCGAAHRSAEKLVDWLVGAVFGERNVLEPALERVVIPHRGPVDAEGGVDGRGQVLRFDVALPGPPRIDQIRAGRVRGAE